MRQLTTADVSALIDDRPIGAFQVYTTLICLLLVVFDGFDTQCIAFVAPGLSNDWHLARSDLGPVFSAGLFGTMLGSLLLAPLGDRYGRKPIALVATAGVALFALLTMAASDVGELIALRILTGLGLGMVLPNAIALTIEYSPLRQRTLLTTLVVLGISLGGMIGGGLSTLLIPEFGWRSVFFVGGLLPLLSLPLVWAFLPESVRFLAAKRRAPEKIATILRRLDPPGDYRDVEIVASAPGSARRGPVRQLFTEGRGQRTLLLWVVFIANLFLMNFMINWLPSVLHEAGLPITQAILANTLFDLGGIIGGLLLAQGVDRWSGSAILPLAYLVTAVAIACVGLFSHHPVALWVAIFLSGVGVIGAFSGVNVLSGTVYPTSIRATGVGWAFGIGRIGSVLGPVAGGIIFALHWTAEQIFLFGALPALVAAAGVFSIAQLRDSRNGEAGQIERL